MLRYMKCTEFNEMLGLGQQAKFNCLTGAHALSNRIQISSYAEAGRPPRATGISGSMSRTSANAAATPGSRLGAGAASCC
jgi:hypothetical protein